METTHIKFIGPKIKHIAEICEDGKVMKIALCLDWSKFGLGYHSIYKESDKYVWTDKQSPIPVRKFPSIDSLMWEYELPISLRTHIEKL
jgi:hypothetical protein